MTLQLIINPTVNTFFISDFHHAFLKSITFYWLTNALNCIKLKG